jgi:hypothetical protein
LQRGVFGQGKQQLPGTLVAAAIVSLPQLGLPDVGCGGRAIFSELGQEIGEKGCPHSVAVLVVILQVGLLLLAPRQPVGE